MGYRFFKSDNIEFVLINNIHINFPKHCHSSDFVITVIMDGGALLITNDLLRKIKAKDFFMIVPYETHSLVSESPVTMISMCIKKRSVYLLDETDYTDQITIALSEFNFGSNLLKLFQENAVKIYKQFHNSFQNKPEFISDILSEIEIDPETEKNIDEFASECFLSKYHFIRKFNGFAGLTPNKFRLQCRIRTAQTLLLKGVSAADTAVMTGFYDQSHMDKYFKKIVGLSPSEYVCSVSNFLQAQT